MTKHLAPPEIVDALEGTLDLTRQAHVDGCATCEREVQALRDVRRQVARSVEMHEPSPLFWTHFSERVAAATRNLEAAAEPRWQRWLRPLLPVAAMAIVALMILNPRESAPPTAEVAEVTTIAAADDLALAPVDDSWDLIVTLASTLGPEAVRDVAMPRPGAADELIEALTPEERDEFLRLLKAGIGSVE
jgi:hypothetical protein